MAQKRKCTSTVSNPKNPRFGNRCSAWAREGSLYCNVHAPDRAEALQRRCVRRKRNGEQCRNAPVHGSTICMKHGQNRFSLAKAQSRLASFTDPALTVLYDLLIKPETSDSDRGKYALAILDRTGLHPGQRLEVGVDTPMWQDLMKGIIRDVPEDMLTLTVIEQSPSDGESVAADADVVENDEPPERPMFAGPRIRPPHSPDERATVTGSLDHPNPPKDRSRPQW